VAVAAWGCASFDPTPGLAGVPSGLDVGFDPTYKWGGLLWGAYITICVIFLCISTETGFNLVATLMSVAKSHLQKGKPKRLLLVKAN
jgi:hypothetical protein